MCASSICALTAVAQNSAPVAEALVPELTLGQVPGLVPSHVRGLASELSPPAAVVKAETVKTERGPIASITIEEVPAPVPTAVASTDPTLAEQVIQSVRQSLGKASGKDERSALAGYYANAAQPLWVDKAGLTPRAKILIVELKRADDWGLRAADFEVPTSAAKADAKPSELADVEVKLSQAALKYARHARGGRVDPNAISDNLDRKAQLVPARDVITGLATATAADDYLRKLHPQHPQFELLRKAYIAMRDGKGPTQTAAVIEPEIKKDGKKKTAEAPAAPPKGSVKKLLANMEMWRWMPSDLGSTHVFVNVPEFQFRLVRDGAVVHTERVITGKIITQTPLFSDRMETVVFKPRWNVPDSIKVKELLPALYKSRDALAKQDLKVELDGQPVDPRQVNWSNTDIRAYHVYQPSGNANALGVVKFLFPNKHAVYLHDTPTKNLFNNASRAYSHGCIRIRNPVRFAEVLMEQDKKWTPLQVKAALAPEAQEDNHIGITKKFPVHISYFTAVAADDGQVTYYKDIYEYEGNINLGIEGKANQIVKPPKDVDTPIEGQTQARSSRRDDPRISAYEKATSSKGSSNPEWAKSLFGFN
jgi:L,D-transpeptidase YcbB